MRNTADCELLIERAKQLIKRNPASEQVMSLMTSSHTIYEYVAQEVSEAAEDIVINKLVNNDDKVVLAVVCMWTESSSLDVPSHHFRERLRQIYSGNNSAYILLQGENGTDLKKLSDTMPV